MTITFRATGREILEFNRVRPLVFGLYAWADTDQYQRVEEAGSGIMVAPGLGLTARHVTSSFSKLDPQVEALIRRRTPLDPQYRVQRVKSESAALVFQEPLQEEPVTWKLKVTWASHDTDVTAVCFEPVSAPALRAAVKGFEYLPWQLLPPRVGKIVRVYGFPQPEIDVVAENHVGDVLYQVSYARVEEQFSPIRVHGFGAFPGFRIDRPLEHGLSGGAVVYDGKLVGIFSGPDYVACLWPLALMTYPDAGEAEQSFADHFDSQLIRAFDWADVKGRVKRWECVEALEGSAVESRCDRKHAVLTS